MDSKLQEQISMIKFLLLEGETFDTFFKCCRFFLKPAYPIQFFTAGFHSLSRTRLDQGGQLRQLPLQWWLRFLTTKIAK